MCADTSKSARPYICLFSSLIQVVVRAAAFAHHRGRAPSVFGGHGRRVAAFAQLVEAAHDPVGDPANGQMGRRSIRRDCPGAARPQVAAHGVDVAAVAQLLDLPGACGGVGAAVHPAVTRMEPVVVDHARAVGCRDEKLLGIGGPGESQDGATAERQFAGDRSQAVATFDAFVDLLVAFAGAGGGRPLPSVHVQFARGGEVNAL
ncbi:hypothetical protein AB0D11_39780 [Streptomyces monashensis]|uniref:hypothetical protein n=1 Tax=Streptomyces monashensis TaxID=1678012 RepID=UPI0033CBBB85